MLAITSILATLAMAFVGMYVRHSKTTEALGSVQSMATQAADFYNQSDTTQPAGTTPEAAHAMRHFPLSSRLSVPSVEIIRGKKFQSSPHDWAVSPWKDLRFSIHQPQYFAYSFESDGSGLTAHAAALAEGDLDGDGKSSLYRLEVHVDDKFVATPASIPVINEE